MAVLIEWSLPAADTQAVQGMLACAGPGAPGGERVIAVGSCALGVGGEVAGPRQADVVQPYHDAQRRVWVAFDGRLDNRQELAAQILPGVGGASDPEILARGYSRWGTELAARLAGDFVFVIWDEHRQALYAARDPFGIRPLFYHASASRLILASQVESLLGFSSQVLEPDVVLDHLIGQHRQVRATFFRDIHRLPPGHVLVARKGTQVECRYWHPPDRLLTQAGSRQCADWFRDSFRRAVADRLVADRPILAQLSGGLDSSSVVCMADAIYRSTGEMDPPLVTVSAVFPGLDCDESVLVDAVRGRVRLTHASWSPTQYAASLLAAGRASGPADWSWSEGWPPGARDLGLAGEFEVARRHGATCILSGFGGDELLYERGIFRDLAAHGRWLWLWRELAPRHRYATSSRQAVLVDALRAVLPTGVRWSLGRGRHPPPAPDWLAPPLHSRWREAREPRPPTLHGFDACLPHRWRYSSHTQQATWLWLTSPALVWGVEELGRLAARHGVEYRFPFLDRRLADLVLALPYESRLPRGRMKRLLRDAMVDLLPAAVRKRRRVTTFESALRQLWQRDLPKLRDLFSGPRWASEPFVVRKAALRMLEAVQDSSEPLDLGICSILWRIGKLEFWLRGRVGREAWSVGREA